jgi:3',5'-cyclic AMP phosphodiesterase CpdA
MKYALCVLVLLPPLVVLPSGLQAQVGQAAGGADTAPAFSFVVCGDNQFATQSPTSGVPERLALPKVVVALKPTFVLHTGDLMDHGYDDGAYDRFAEYYREMLAAAPFFPTMGNHDAGKGIGNYTAFLADQLRRRNAAVYGPGYAAQFVLHFRDDPGEYPTSFSDPGVAAARRLVPSGVSFKTYYSVRYGNAVFISLEQGTRWWANTPLAWLEEALRSARTDAGVDHLVVFMHHPMYSSVMLDEPPDPAKPGSGECMLPVRRICEGLFRQHDVTLVFSGHAHLYDRFCVPDDGTPTRTAPPPERYPHDGKAIHYIVTGGGGGPLNRGDWKELTSWPFSQNRLCAYHVVEVQVRGRELTVRAHRVSGTAEQAGQSLIEEFRIGP